MTGTEAFHDGLPQPYRIQKRLALNQCFKAIRNGMPEPRNLTYITFGGEDLYDLMDLVGVYSLRSLSLNVFSYEQDRSKAKKSRTCPVAATLSKIKTVKINIVRAAFPSATERLLTLRPKSPFVYFLDYTGTFSSRQRETISELLDLGLLLAGDHLLITSCVSPRIVHQEQFMSEHLASYRLQWPGHKVDVEFKARNHVEVLVSKAFERFEQTTRANRHGMLTAKLLEKFRYRDSRSPMGLWAYRIEEEKARNISSDRLFDDFPLSFSKSDKSSDDIPDIFSGM